MNILPSQTPLAGPIKTALIAMLMAGAAHAQAPEAPDAQMHRPQPRPEHEARAPLTHGLAGPYLAARLATVENDFSAAAEYFARSADALPNDVYLQDNAILALISAGRMDRAAQITDDLFRDGNETELAALVRRAQLIRAGDWQGLLALIEAHRDADAGINDDLMDGIVRGWALLGAGRAQDALAAFQALADNPSLAPVVNYHLALARALVGDYETAETLLDEADGLADLMGLVTRIQILAQLDRRDEALALLDKVQEIEAEPQLVALRDALRDDQPVPFDVVGGPGDGIAHLLLSFASALASSPDPEPLALVHARIASWLAPEDAESRLMVAQLLQDRQQFDLAEAEFAAVRKMGEMRPVAELSRIDALSRAGRRDAAEQAALALTAAYPQLSQAWIALGDVLRQQEKFDSAVPAYDRALTMLKDAPEGARWFPLYARGIALERAGQFDRAEKDLLAALEIRPDHASCLNYLGYSWIDRNENLDRALAMIQKAVELSPGDGYILDSLAWAYFRMGRYQDAVAPMEAAVASMSADPLVNDHLGDIYWKVGRHREAEIQWQRALSLEPTDTGDVDPDRIRAKLDRGLDRVLAEETARGDTADAPLPDAQDTAAE